MLLSAAHAQLVTIPIPGSPLSLTVQANPQPLQDIKNNPAATAHNLGDDGWANVPLPFGFPFYGQTFTDSTMYSNGAVQFGRTVNGNSFPNWNNSFCCQGMRLTPELGNGYNYSIIPLWTDLTGYQNNHYTLGTANSMTYGWYGVAQYGSNNTSSFELKIDNTGGVDMRWSGALVTYAPVTIGTIGDASKGEYTQHYFSESGINITGLTQLATGQDLCVANPLWSPACPGYQEAYTQQQCLISPLYSSSCLGYAAAYQTQQCTVDPLYSAQCPGYDTAYKTQQCTVNPLYATDCPGYEQAYLNDQCIRDSLYSRLCSGYATAYAIKYLVPLESGTSAAINQSLSTTAAVKANDPASVNSTVDSVLTAPSTTSPTSPTSVISAPVPVPGAPAPTAKAVEQAAAPSQPAPAAQQERAAENKKTEGAVASVERRAGGNPTAARAAATERARELAREAGNAKTLEAQAATQGQVVGLMAYVPGFNAYQNTLVPDVLGAQVARQYSKPTVDNRSAQRQLSGRNELRWQEIVDSQYKGK